MKCLYCGKSILLGKIKLADGYIHTKCFRKLGFDNCFDLAMDTTPFNDIKDGYDVYCHNSVTSHATTPISFANFGQERDLICTEEERQIYDGVCRILDDDKPRLVRTSDNYVSIKYGDYDLMRFKYTNRARWFNFPMLEKGDMKHYIDDVDDLDEYAVVLKDSVDEIRKFSGE